MSAGGELPGRPEPGQRARAVTTFGVAREALPIQLVQHPHDVVDPGGTDSS